MLQSESLGLFRNEVPIFSNISFSLMKGQHLLLSGSNGSGKTSLLRTLCSLTNQTSGDIRWNNSDVRSIDNDYLDQIAFLGHKNGLIDELTLLENLEVIYGESIDSEMLKSLMYKFNLSSLQQTLYSNLSNGQKRKTALIRVILSSKLVWILDEPFTNLDTESMILMDEIFKKHLDDGGMIVSTSNNTKNEIICDTEINLDEIVNAF